MAEKLASLRKKGGGKSKVSTGYIASGSSINVTTNFKPKYIYAFGYYGTGTGIIGYVYDESVSTTQYKYFYTNNEFTANVGASDIAGGFMSINNNGFTLTGYAMYNYNYIAVG